MKRFCLLGAVIGAAMMLGAANAQPPREIAVTDSIEMQVGQTKILQFDQQISKVSTTSDGLVEVVPQSDRTFTVRAVESGSTILVAYGKDGGVAHQMNIDVAGHMVKIYGQGLGKKGMGFIGVICTGASCGRPDPDVVPAPSSTTISETKQKPDGSTTTEMRTYH